MEVTIKTETLRTMVSKAFKCSSNNKLIPITSLMNIKCDGSKLTLTTTDASNYFYVSANVDATDAVFEVSVIAETFAKLIHKTTATTTTLIVDGTVFKVKGNGVYTMELPLDENGNTISFPTKLTQETSTVATLNTQDIKSVLNYNKPSLAITMEVPSLTNYYCGDITVTSNGYLLCANHISMFNTPMLISGIAMELLGCMSGESITASKGGDVMIYTSANEVLYTPIVSEVDAFPIEAINTLLDTQFDSVCKVSKDALLDMIDRLTIFVSPYDKRSIYMTFTNDGIIFSNKQSSGSEKVGYISCDDFKPFTCCIDSEMFRSQVSTQSGSDVTIGFGSEKAIKLTSSNVTEIVALSEDDRVGE